MGSAHVIGGLQRAGRSLCCAMLWLGADVAAAHGSWLITPDEAALAPAPEETFIRSRGVGESGPLIDVLQPADGAALPSPLEIVVRFVPQAAAVNLASLRVTLLKFISIDITDRVKPYVTAEGIHLREAQIPAGKHQVRISLSDAKGAISIRDLSFEVR